MPLTKPPLSPADDEPRPDPSLGIPDTPTGMTGGNEYASRVAGTGNQELLELLRRIEDQVNKAEKHLDRLANKKGQGMVPEILERLEKIERHLDELTGSSRGGSTARRSPGSVPPRSRSR